MLIFGVTHIVQVGGVQESILFAEAGSPEFVVIPELNSVLKNLLNSVTIED